ncbi:MBOAT family protein [uncultured Maribacter sp.]|uniref:MBOAT family O-acyltransferase n=1 Tax=uncultured Maribacter sp. TaxID=431308 RepID=UPI00260496A0|nr:MBOAT family O-acyltransferase [uncultured Maribacter sp.]
MTKNSFLVLASYFFYGYWDWRFLSLLLLSSVIDFYLGQAMAKTSVQKMKKRLLMISLFSNLGILAFFKYFNFFVGSFEEITQIFEENLDYLHLNIILPVGISFYTFQTLSYTIDVYRGRLKPTNNFVDFALFVSFFPQLVAGPIERASSLLPQFSTRLSPSKKQIKEGVFLIITGLFRKVLIGDTAGKYVDQLFGNMQLYTGAELIAGLILFSIQIYADFSGYSRVARGTAKLLGVDLMVNFEQPYFSRNITEFWRRWHISLSSCLKDYLYISLGGNRYGISRTYINLMLTMLLGGLWHGASWNFVIWGGLHGMYLALHKFFLGTKKVSNEAIKRVSLKTIFQIMSTYVLVLFTWLFFRASSWEATTLFFKKIINWQNSEYGSYLLLVSAAFVLAVIVIDLLDYNDGVLLRGKFSKAFRYGALTCMFIITLAYMFQAKSSPFIYFAF